jgi:hypothetical protein
MVCHGQLAARVVRMHGWTSHPWHPALALTEFDPQNSLGAKHWQCERLTGIYPLKGFTPTFAQHGLQNASHMGFIINDLSGLSRHKPRHWQSVEEKSGNRLLRSGSRGL